MPSIVVPVAGLALGPGYLYYAPLGTALPEHTVTGSVFTDPWPTAWEPVGITKEGHEFSYSVDSEGVEVAELLDPPAYATTGREIGINFEMARVTLSLEKLALNGGTIVSTGSDETQLNQFTPPELGEETRVMLGWESTDNTERIVAYQCFQSGEVSTARRKGSDNATLPVEFRLERAPGMPPYHKWTAGSVRI
jgi:hypothetical protein